MSISDKGIAEKLDQNVLNSASNKDDNKVTAQPDGQAPNECEISELAKGERGGDKPVSKKTKDGSKRSYARQKRDHPDLDRSGRASQGSREFVRGGRGKAYGRGRWRGGGSRENRGGYNENYEGQYDVELERYESAHIDINRKGQGVDDTSEAGGGGGGGKQLHMDGHWQNNQNKGALKNGGSKNKERGPRGQRGNWQFDERISQENSLGREKFGGNRQRPSKQQIDEKETGVAAAVATVPGDADREKDAPKQEQSLKSASLKDLDSKPIKELSLQDEGKLFALVLF